MDEQIFKKDKKVELQIQLGELMEQNKNLEKQCLDSKKSLIDSTNIFEEQKSKLIKEYEAKLIDLNTVLETEKKSVARKVNQELASIGVSKFAVEEISPESSNYSPTKLCEKFTSMPEGNEKQEFWKKHGLIISQYMGLR